MLKNCPNSSLFSSYPAICVSVLLWSAAYECARYLLPSKPPEYCSRIIALLHGLTGTVLGINQCFLNGLPFRHPEFYTTSVQSFIIVSSLGYFIYDLTWCAVYRTETKLMIAHHAYAICSLYRVLRKSHFGAHACCSIGFMEVTNPFLQSRWFLRSAGYSNTWIFYATEFTFIIMFAVVRILLGTYCILVMFWTKGNSFEIRILGVVIYVISWAFFINIVNYVVKKYHMQKAETSLSK